MQPDASFKRQEECLQHDAGCKRQIKGSLMSAHGITGMIAIILMMIHAVWATVVLARRDEKAMHTFHRFSIIVWVIWLIPFVLGMMMGMR